MEALFLLPLFCDVPSSPKEKRWLMLPPKPKEPKEERKEGRSPSGANSQIFLHSRTWGSLVVRADKIPTVLLHVWILCTTCVCSCYAQAIMPGTSSRTSNIYFINCSNEQQQDLQDTFPFVHVTVKTSQRSKLSLNIYWSGLKRNLIRPLWAN